MANMKTVTVHNQTERGVTIAGVYVSAGGSGRVDPKDEYLQNLVSRGSLVIVEPVAQAVEEPVEAEVVEDEATDAVAEVVEEEIAEEEDASDEAPATPKRATKSSSRQSKTTS